ncbi:DedA family protein [Candidatus Riesia pediculischaeffi]|uniref:VTT domain-containing protein n=2 Tax=Candidatus Riesia pediculischaeffi TaxID=428411 RepID=A0A1V0HL01_9ENTR|nr:DedA family protein [Candidatus Riesia pediculischaeffi]ARC53493.1 hypothetical protein AOQ87_02500 [Candidatus Riesia pediculischaeffi]KIE64293.1 DedA family inner membrane protein YqjA [Candidatus Riesia pediculischaeffi PTSU]
MKLIKNIFLSIWYQDFGDIINSSSECTIYIVLFFILFCENGLLFASFLPGDSLLILTGLLIARNKIDFFKTIVVLTAGTSLGSWIGYLQGRWFGKNDKFGAMFFCKKYQKKAHLLLENYGLFALFLGRFLAFVRTILPMITGFLGFSHKKFQIFNWISGITWTFVLISVGYFLSISNVFHRYENKIVKILIFTPLSLLLSGFLFFLFSFLRRKYLRKMN